MSEDTHDIKKETKKYYLVFVALIVLSVLTVGASYIHWGVALGVAVALIIATLKGSLVASFFMHLASEKKLIYVVLIFTMIFFISMMFLIIAAYHDTPEGLEYIEPQPAVETQDHHASGGEEHVS